MSRLSGLAVSACLLSGILASACPTCQLPPASAPVSDASPQAVFEAAAPGSLLAEEREWLLALEGGRYEQVNGRLLDRKAAADAQHLLTNSAAWALLGRRATERTAVLRALAKDGRLPEPARGEAVALFWTRGTLVSNADRAFLREATNPQPKPERGGRFPTASGSGTSSPYGSVVRSDLLQELRAALEIAPDADPRAAPALNEALDNLVMTPTGREIALEFTAFGAKATVELCDIDNSMTVIINGRRVLSGSDGYTDSYAHPPRVCLNRRYLDTDPDYRRVNMAGTLGHELFGHAFEVQRISKAGLTNDSRRHYRGDEANAGLIGWLVGTELGGPLDNSHMWNYLADPERYYRHQQTTLLDYSARLSLADMRSPVAALEGRLAAVDAERRRTRDSVAPMPMWRLHIEHFVTVHKIPRAPFSSLLEEIAGYEQGSAGHLRNLDEIETHLTSTTEKWKKPAADAFKADLAAAAGSDYMRQAEQRLIAYAERLRGLVAGRTREPSVPPVPGKLTWDDLEALIEQDRKDNPDHWEKKK